MSSWGVSKRTVPSDTLLVIFWLSVAADAAPAYRDLTCCYDSDTSVALDAGDLSALDFDNETDVRSGCIVRLSESAPAVYDDVARPWSDGSILLPDAECLEDLDVSRDTALSSDLVNAA